MLLWSCKVVLTCCYAVVTHGKKSVKNYFKILLKILHNLKVIIDLLYRISEGQFLMVILQVSWPYLNRSPRSAALTATRKDLMLLRNNYRS